MKNYKYSKILTKDFLYNEYTVNKKSTTQIAKEIGCSSHAVSDNLIKNDIYIRTISEAKNPMVSKILTKTFLTKEYIKNKKSIYQIAEETGCIATTIYNYLKKYDIKIRTNSETHSKWDKILTKDFLIKEYIKNKKSFTQIAKEVGCSQNGVRYNLIKHKIEIRDSGEGNIGKNNWNWKGGLSSKQYYCSECGRPINIATALYGGSGLCNYCAYLGKRSSNWQGGKSFEPYPLGWTKTLKESIRQRDNHQCQICDKLQKNIKLSVHHIDYNKANLNPENLISLCNKCHTKTNTNRNYWTNYFKNLSKEKIYVNN